MACKTCGEHKHNAPEEPKVTPFNRFSMNCPNCGLTRMLPAGIKDGQEFQLVPCPKCMVPFKGKFLGEQVQEIL